MVTNLIVLYYPEGYQRTVLTESMSNILPKLTIDANILGDGEASQRPDVRFILYINPKYTNQNSFANQKDSAFVREKPFSGSSPREIVSISPYYLVSFFRGKEYERSMEPIEDNLTNYLKEWKQLREAKP